MRTTRRTAFRQLLLGGAAHALLGAKPLSADTVEYAYDELGRIKTVTYSNGATITYTYDPAGNRTELLQTPPTHPSADLTASPVTINQGASSTLTWATTNTVTSSINNGVGTVTPSSGGSVSVSPSVTTTYTLTATNPLGADTDDATVTVIPAPTLVASPTTIAIPGGSSSLSWTTSSATSASIDQGIGAVSPLAAGSVSVTPSVATTYTLTVNGPGGVATAQATVTPVFTKTIDITGSGPVNLRTLANADGYTGIGANITFEVESGTTITGTAGTADGAGGIAIDTGTWPASGVTLALVIKNGGKVRGGGGGGGNGGLGGLPYGAGTVGGAGGDAIYCRTPMTVTINSGGELRGGGGGGHGGSGSNNGDPFEPVDYGGGGGGGGKPNGAGGYGNYGASNGTAGTATTVGAGGSSPNASGGANGGDWATQGSGAGGVGGYAVRKNGHSVSVANNGTMSGSAA